MSDPSFDAVLRNWIILRFSNHPDAPPALVGQVMHDRKGRFPDGRWIVTSIVLTAPNRLRAGEIVETLNTRYLLAGSVH